MRGTDCVETFDSIAALPPEALTLMDDAAGMFAGRDWWNVVLAHAMPAGAVASFVGIRSGGKIVALLPMLLASGQLGSLTTPYTCLYRAVVRPRVGPACPHHRHGSVRWVLPDIRVWCGSMRCRPSGMALGDLEAGVRLAGLRTLRFDHFGNWSEDVAGLDWPAYLQSRPGALRETIRRRLRRAEKLSDARFDLFTRPGQMDQAAEAFESVYRRSWKDAEPFPTFNAAFMRVMAEAGLLRLGVWSIGTEAVAVQFWVVKDSRAIVLKLAHDEAFKAHSPGTVLSALMLRHLLEQEHVTAIDFGRGDDAYKQGWAVTRRQRIGLLLVNPWRPAGAAALLRHGAGRIRAALTGRGTGSINQKGR